MGKIIIVTFAFMAFAFYELSGGDEFVPIAEEKRAALEFEKAEKARLLAEAKSEAQERAPQPEAQIVLASARVVEPQPEAAKNDEVMAAVAAALEADKAEAVTEEAPAQVAEIAEESEAEPAKDIREVSAARVNMRNGPGQKFNVLAKLSGGDQVEILQDPGDGWVKLRVVENGRVGWMADFLLTAANN